MKSNYKVILLSLLLTTQCFADNAWHCVARIITCHTWRMEVPGGWIVSGDNGDSAHYAMTYFPDEQHKWKI